MLDFADYDALRAEQARLRAAGRYLGIGLVTATEISGGGPFESADVRVEPSGAVTVSTGISPHGQGEETTFAQIVADELGVAMADIIVVHGDTARTPPGIGTFGSRGLVVGGSALVRALESVKEKARRIAAHLLEAAPEDIEFREGRFGVTGAADRAVTLKEIAAAAYGQRLPAEISLRPRIGRVLPARTLRLPLQRGHLRRRGGRGDRRGDAARLLHGGRLRPGDQPAARGGPGHGGLAQGIAQALWEEVVYDASGQLVTGSLMDYAVPTARAFPQFATDADRDADAVQSARREGDRRTGDGQRAARRRQCRAGCARAVRHPASRYAPARRTHLAGDPRCAAIGVNTRT